MGTVHDGVTVSHFSFCSLPARQAIKNPPRRLTGVMVRSPAGSTSPGGDYSLGDLSQPAGDEASPGVRILLWVGGKAQPGTWGSASITEKGPGEKPLPCFADFRCCSVVGDSAARDPLPCLW